MYSSYYGFREDPFSLLPDPDFLFLSQKHETALNLLEMAILNQSAFCVISGDIGTGKTTLIRELLNRLDDKICIGLISNTHNEFTDLLSWVISAYGLEVSSGEPVMLYRQFADFVSDQHANGKHTLLIIDEAQHLSISALEELRMLSNINSERDAFLQIILVGQTELLNTLRKPELAQVMQRVSVVHHLPSLSEIETEAYVQHRLRTAGGPADLIDTNACQQIYRYSRGIPRLINKLCDLSLVYGYAEELPRIGADIVRAVVQEQKPMGLHEHSAVNAPSGTSRPPAKAPGKVGLLPVKTKASKHQNNDNRNENPQRGDKTMTGIPEEYPSSDRQKPANAEALNTESEQAADVQKIAQPVNKPVEDVHALARTAAEEKAAAERIAHEKAEAAKSAIEKAAADLAALESARTAKIQADALAAESAAADRLAVAQAAETLAAAEKAKADTIAAEKHLRETQEVAQQAADHLAEITQSTEKMVAEQAALENTAREKAAVAKKIAEEAAAAAEAAADEAQQAFLHRVSAERVAADKVGGAEKSATHAAAELENSLNKKAERVNIEKDAASKAEAARIEAETAAREKGAAVRGSQEKRSIAKQAAEQADMTRAAAEAAAAELEAAEKIASDKELREKVALADVAASIAAAAQKEAEEAAAAQTAALEVARRKQAIAKEAARKAAEASLAVKRVPDAVPTTIRMSELVKTAAADDMPAAILEKQQKGKPGRTWFLMMLTAVIAGASGWLALNRVSGGDQAGNNVMAEKKHQPAVSAAALEVKKGVDE